MSHSAGFAPGTSAVLQGQEPPALVSKKNFQEMT
jgi:hypothetical protein